MLNIYKSTEYMYKVYNRRTRARTHAHTHIIECSRNRPEILVWGGGVEEVKGNCLL